MGVDKTREKQVSEAEEFQCSCIRTAKSAVMLQQQFPKRLTERGSALSSSDLKGCSSQHLVTGSDRNKGAMKNTTKQTCSCFKDGFELC